MRLIFFGSGAFGLPTLQALTQHHEIALVVTQPDRPAGRNKALTPTPIGEFAQQQSISILKPEVVNEAAWVEKIRGENADAFVVIAFGQKLSTALLADRFAINLHASLLPKYRGAAPIQWAMIRGESETGLSVITLANRMDAGEILGQSRTFIDPLETAGELHDRLAEMGPSLVQHVLDQFQHNALCRSAQDESMATVAPKLSKSEGTVRFDQSAIHVRQRVHGLTPWPGCTVKLHERLVRLHRVQEIQATGNLESPGTVLQDCTIACTDRTALRILEVQPPGGKLMSFEAYRNGQPVPPGSRCEPL